MGGPLLVCFFNSLVPHQKLPPSAILKYRCFPFEINIYNLHYNLRPTDPYKVKRMSDVNVW